MSIFKKIIPLFLLVSTFVVACGKTSTPPPPDAPTGETEDQLKELGE